MNVINQTEAYIKDCLSIKHDKSVEYYFGENNSLKTRLIDWIADMREVVSAAAKDNPNFMPKDGLAKIKDKGNVLSKIICDEFNVEGCTVAWFNTMNACCYSQLSNSDLYGKGDNAKDLRIKLNDIVDTTNGFKYKNKKGIYYVVCLGYPLFCLDKFFTAEEAAAVLVHELGHAMQHVVNTLNQTIGISVYKSLYNTLSNNSVDSYSYKKYLKRMFKRLRNDIKNDNKSDIDKIVNDFLDDSRKSDGFSFSEADEDRVRGAIPDGQDWELNVDKYLENKMERVNDKRNKFSTKFISVLKAIVSTVTIIPSLVFSITILRKNSKMKKDYDLNLMKIFEETADDFCQIYGLGVAQASALKKLNQLSNSMTVRYGNMMEKIPILDFYWSYKEMLDDYESALSGYPSDKQRMMNLYRSAKFELQNNKDLTAENKAELNKQLEDYKNLYDEFVKIDSKKGWLYRLVAGFNRDKLEEEAKKDSSVYRNVLIPLQKRMDPKFDPYTEYTD